ncbi:MAG: alkaline phosphatase family protein [Candidatus Saccharibacteria bacterium]|nr:alkaline phosphatase family protein [Candidatus Saccharibacteria bacterium]
MKVKNNYDECLTNLACSIRKYFDLPIKHKTLDIIDEYLEKNNPTNVVVILLDGMGANILKRTLPDNSFFLKNLKKSITTVFPATTTAATTSIRTGLNPVEHGWLGWTTYIEPIDKVITLFMNTEKGHDGEICEEFLKVKDKLVTKTIVNEIEEANKHKALELMPFGDDAYNGLDDMLEKIKDETKKPGKKYIYAYDTEPDSTMHDTSPDDEKVKELIKERNDKIEKLASELKDTLLIVVADHGHMKTENLFLKDYPDVFNLLARKTSIDQRAVSFKVKDGKKAEFRQKFEEHFKDYYDLYDSKDIIDSKLFGDGPENELFRPALGDFLAIAKDKVCLVTPGDEILSSHHAGYTDDEVYVPVIIKEC